ncbi:MAG: Hsp20/alpha crystallin family protein [Anaerolineales bacterium]|nr:Hsp20/alpha crystallin family protein [Anaerolineales bacterium]
MENVARWDTNREFMTLREAMNRLFEDSFVGGYRQHNGSQDAEMRLPIEAYSTDRDIVVRAAVPGLKPEAVEITVEGDTLTLRGEFPRPIENVNYFIDERPWGRFSRTLQLNVPIEAGKAEAVFENGLLTLTLPKAEAVRPKVIPVKAK